ncbi:MAG TPA: hypothetical protein VFA44_08885 [Gaiellaceae bacterium]|nr:hypothetical protein [Gaiellaceae bacterium]
MRALQELVDAREAFEVEQVKALAGRAGPALRASVAAGLAGLAGLMLWAATGDYPLRVTSDTPTYMALVRDMAARPFARQSPYLALPGVASPHATPYEQSIGLLWRFLGLEGPQPHVLARLLALLGVLVFGFTLLAVFLYARRLAGSRAAWLSLPILLGLFGPPHVIWASDLTLHGALYAGFYPQNLALALALATLLALDSSRRAALPLATVLAAAALLVHPFTGSLLALVATAEACRLARREGWRFLRAPLALGAGFLLALAWPAYSVDDALSQTGVAGHTFIAACALAPVLVHLLPLGRPGRRIRAVAYSILEAVGSQRSALGLSLVGAAATAGLVVWEFALVAHPPADQPRLAVYWVDGRWRWPFLFAAGTVGVAGLARLARRGQIVPGVWFAGCFAIGSAGALGLPLAVWYRFLLLCQVPLAIGVAAVVAEARRRPVAILTGATLASAIVVKVVTLVGLPPTVTYVGSSLQPIWSLGEHLPPGPGLVATDPNTAYYIPAATGHRVLTVGKGHVGSPAELAAAAAGYRLLRRFYAGGKDWWQAGEEMWRRGVRYVVVEKSTTLEPPSLSAFTWQAALLKTPAQRRALGNYFYENNRVGRLVYDSPEYAVYRLDEKKLFGPKGARGTT